jgi:hypothetical protein
MFNAKGGDGVAADLPQGWQPRRPAAARLDQPSRRKCYGQTIRFKLPDNSVVEVTLVITTRRRWETKIKDKSGWTVMPFLRSWVVLLQVSI